MQDPTYLIGQRVSLDGQLGYVRETTAPTVNTVLVEFDKPIPGNLTRHAFVWASDLALIDDDPLESHDTANGALWPRTIEEAIDLSEALGILPSALFGGLEQMQSRRPNYAALEAAWLGDPAPAPAGGDDL